MKDIFKPESNAKVRPFDIMLMHVKPPSLTMKGYRSRSKNMNRLATEIKRSLFLKI